MIRLRNPDASQPLEGISAKDWEMMKMAQDVALRIVDPASARTFFDKMKQGSIDEAAMSIGGEPTAMMLVLLYYAHQLSNHVLSKYGERE